MNNKNGFTLIELLAILVILAIIAVITIPKINKVINESKQNAARNSAYGYKDAIEKWQTSQFEVEDIYLDGNYTVSNGKLDNYSIPITGSAPSSGYLTYEDDDLISGCLVINGYEAIYQNGKFTSSGKGDCGGVMSSTPKESIFYTNRIGKDVITIPTAQLDPSWDIYAKYNFGVIQGYVETGLFGEYDSLSSCEININNSYEKCENIDGTYKIKSYNGIFSTIQECESDINPPVSCVEIDESLRTNAEFVNEFHEGNVTAEICGIFNGTEVCIEPNKWEGINGGNYIQNKKTEYENAGCICTLSESKLFCGNKSLELSAYDEGDIWIENQNDDVCEANNNSISCYNVENTAN